MRPQGRCYRYGRQAGATDTAAGPVLPIRPRGRCYRYGRQAGARPDAAGPDSEPTQPAQIRSRPVTALFPDDGRGPRARERRGEMPLAPQRAVRPPSPEATCDLTPGDSCQSKLGPRPQAVNTPLWIRLWTVWGKPGVSLWISVEYACAVRDGRTCPTGRTWDDTVHRLWTRIAGPRPRIPGQSAAVFMIPGCLSRTSATRIMETRGAGLDVGQGWTPGRAGRRAGLGVWRD
jgi:hypothetical protein